MKDVDLSDLAAPSQQGGDVDLSDLAAPAPAAPAEGWQYKPSAEADARHAAIVQEVDAVKPGMVDRLYNGMSWGLGQLVGGEAAHRDVEQAKKATGFGGDLVEIAGSLPATIAAGPSMVAQGGLGAFQGYANSDADTVGGRLADAAKQGAASMAATKVASVASKGLGTVGQWLMKKHGVARDALAREAAATAAAGTQSAAGKLGSVTADASRGIEKLESAVAKGLPIADDAARVLSQPEIQALENQVAANYARKLPGLSVAEREARAALDAMRASEAQRTAEVFAQRSRAPMTTAAKRVAQEIPGAKATMGFIGEARKAMSDPAVAMSALKTIKTALVDAPEALGQFLGPLSKAAARGDDALKATDFILQTLGGGDGAAYREILKQLEKPTSQNAPPGSRMMNY